VQRVLENGFLTTQAKASTPFTQSIKFLKAFLKQFFVADVLFN
jgi:hypothetical protein